MLVCNYRKCRETLKKDAIATICRHIFCAAHSPLHLQTSDGFFQCPACKSRLKENSDIFEVDMQPCERFRSLILMGQTPETVLDICSRAIEFHYTQITQECRYLEYINYKLQEKCANMEKESKSLLSSYEQKVKSLQNEKDSLEKECEELRDKLVSASHKLSKLEGDISRQNSSKRTNSNHACHSDHLLPGSVQSTLSADNMQRKFPRCTPDSTHPSPFHMKSRYAQLTFYRRPEPSASNHFPGHTSRQSPSKLVYPNHFLSGSIKNLTKRGRSAF